MANLGSVRLEKIKNDVIEWYFKSRDMLIKDMEADGFPYGSVKLTPMEQLIHYRGLTAEDWQVMVEQLYDRYRGLPDASSKVAEQLDRYKGRMETLNRQFGSRNNFTVGSV